MGKRALLLFIISEVVIIALVSQVEGARMNPAELWALILAIVALAASATGVVLSILQIRVARYEVQGQREERESRIYKPSAEEIEKYSKKQMVSGVLVLFSLLPLLFIFYRSISYLRNDLEVEAAARRGLELQVETLQRYANSVEELNKRLSSAERELADLQKSLRRLEQEPQLKDQLSELKRKEESLVKQLQAIRKQIEAAENRMNM